MTAIALRFIYILVLPVCFTLLIIFKSPIALYINPEHQVPIAIGVVTITSLQFVISLDTNKSSKLKSKADLHVRRKIQHALSGIMIVIAKSYFTSSQAVIVLLLCAAVFFVIHRLRLQSPAVNDIFMAAFGPILRPHEARSLPGAFYFLVGSALSLAFFDNDTATLSILFLSVGDPMASYIGVLYGKKKIGFLKQKSVVGVVACGVTCSVVTFIYNKQYNMLLGGVCGAIAEVLAIGDLDDNLTMPIIAGGLLQLYKVFYLL